MEAIPCLWEKGALHLPVPTMKTYYSSPTLECQKCSSRKASPPLPQPCPFPQAPPPSLGINEVLPDFPPAAPTSYQHDCLSIAQILSQKNRFSLSKKQGIRRQPSSFLTLLLPATIPVSRVIFCPPFSCPCSLHHCCLLIKHPHFDTGPVFILSNSPLPAEEASPSDLLPILLLLPLGV